MHGNASQAFAGLAKLLLKALSKSVVGPNQKGCMDWVVGLGCDALSCSLDGVRVCKVTSLK